MPEPILVGDIGGTGTRLAVARNGVVGQVRVLRTGDFPRFQDAIGTFLADLPATDRPTRARIAVAAPIGGDTVRLTNAPWEFSIAQARAELGLPGLRVMNDFAALAMAVPFLAPADFVTIGPATPHGPGPIVVLGPGTGLGVATLLPGTGGWRVLPGEGGHVTMAPATPPQAQVLDFLRDRLGGHVSAERVLSGQGLENLHTALRALAGMTEEPLKAPEITARALASTDPVCVQVLAMFCAMLGTIAGNAALTLGASGGVVLAGGILPRMVRALQASAFRDRFEAKGRSRTYVAAIPTRLIVHPTPALVGLANSVDDTY